MSVVFVGYFCLFICVGCEGYGLYIFGCKG